MRRLLLAVPFTLFAFACGTSEDDRGLFSNTKGGAAGAQAGKSGSATAGTNAAGTGTAGTGTAGTGTAGTGTAGTGTAGTGTAGSGTAGTGTGNNGGSGTGNNGGSGTGNSGGSGPVVPPTDCATAHGVIGCCSPDGKTNYWFGNGQLNADACKDGEICGWSAQAGYYVCIAGSTPVVDPSGKYPLSCGLPKPEGTCDQGTGGSGTAGAPGTGGSGPNPFGGAPPQGGSSSTAGSGTAGNPPDVVCGGVPCMPAFPGLPACCTPDAKCGIELQPGSCIPF